MNTHNIELPAEFLSGNSVPVTVATIKRERMEEILRAAIEPYKQCIAEMEAELEAIGAGGVDGRRITPSNTSAKITERSQAYLDSNLGADEHAAFIKWAREAHDYPEYARLILDSEWCQGAVAGWQGAVEAARQRGGEPVAWHTEDHLTDKSATTYDPVVADRWRAKGWPVNALYAAPQSAAPKFGEE